MFFVIYSSYIKVINHLHRNRRKASDFYFSHKPKMSSRKQIATFQILVQMEGVTATARRKFFTDAPHIDGIIKEILSEIACSSKVSQEDGEKHHDEKSFDMFD